MTPHTLYEEFTKIDNLPEHNMIAALDKLSLAEACLVVGYGIGTGKAQLAWLQCLAHVQRRARLLAGSRST